MFVIRPIQLSDERALINLAFSAHSGIVSLPKDKKLLKEKIQSSIDSFNKEVYAPQNEKYLFALEDTERCTLSGVCGIYSKTGVDYPSYFYEIQEENKEKKGLISNKLLKRKLLVVKEYKHGPSETCSLLLDSNYRREGLGTLLSLSRLLFIAANRIRFDDIIMASLRGVTNEKDRSIFWENVGRHLFDVELTTLHEMLKHEQSFVKEILPKWPIYISLLTIEAQKVIGKPHQNSVPALKILSKQGFNVINEIDPFDGGPILKAFVDQLPFIVNSQIAKISNISINQSGSNSFIICNNSLDFRACFASIKKYADGTVSVSKDVAKALGVIPGDEIRYSKIM